MEVQADAMKLAMVKHGCVGSLYTIQTKSLMLAQTVIFSFLQKQRHPSRDHFLFHILQHLAKM